MNHPAMLPALEVSGDLSEEEVQAVVRGRRQIAEGKCHDLDDVIREIEAIVSGDEEPSASEAVSSYRP